MRRLSDSTYDTSVNVNPAWASQAHTASAISFMLGEVSIPYVWVPKLTRKDPRAKYCALEIWFPILDVDGRQERTTIRWPETSSPTYVGCVRRCGCPGR